MSFYLDTNIFYQYYCPSEHSEIIDWMFSQFSDKNLALTCEITISEIFRAFKKQVNLGVITLHEMDVALDFFLIDIKRMVSLNKLQLLPISLDDVVQSRSFIIAQNLFAIDAIHAVIAKRKYPKAFITLDSDFKVDINGIRILNPKTAQFKEIFASMMSYEC